MNTAPDAYPFSGESKLPGVQTSIFAVMSAWAQEKKAINLAQGFPNFDCSDKLKALVSQYMQLGMNQYAPMPGLPSLRQRISEKIQRLYHKHVDPDTEITITAGATQALFAAISALVKTGDEVILVEPAYDSYAPAVILQGGIPVPYALRAPHYAIDWDEIGALINPRTRLLIINNPHNPSGRILQQGDLLRLQELLDGTRVLLLSDEVYEHLVFDGKSHESVLKYESLYARSMLTFSFGKTFHNTGWKIGYTVAPPLLSQEFRKVHQFMVFSVNTPIQHALAEYLKDPDKYLILPYFYQHKRDLFLKLMEHSGFIPLRCEGSYFQLFDYSPFSDSPDREFAMRLTEEAGVATIPVSAFYTRPVGDRVIRVCFAKTDETLEEAAAKLRAWGAGV